MGRNDVQEREMLALRKGKANLETLIDTSPVGVAVFDGRTGTVVSANREMLRIVDGLRDPGQPPEHLLEALTVRRADGREISLEELPLPRAPGAGLSSRRTMSVMSTAAGLAQTGSALISALTLD